MAGLPFARTLTALDAALAAAALGGAAWLVGHPADALPADVTARLPLPDWRWAGGLLAAAVGVPAGAGVAGALTGRRWAHPAHAVVGLALTGWIAVEVLVLGFSSWLQPALAGWGVLLLLLGGAHERAWFREPVPSRLERSVPLPGDDPALVADTRAVTVDRPPHVVWRRLLRWTPGTGWPVYSPDPGRVLQWTGPGTTGVWLLRPTAGGGTRVVGRVRVRPGSPLHRLRAAARLRHTLLTLAGEQPGPLTADPGLAALPGPRRPRRGWSRPETATDSGRPRSRGGRDERPQAP